MPSVFVARPTATQNSPFLPQRWPKPSLLVVAPTRVGQAEWAVLCTLGIGLKHAGMYTRNLSTLHRSVEAVDSYFSLCYIFYIGKQLTCYVIAHGPKPLHSYLGVWCHKIVFLYNKV